MADWSTDTPRLAPADYQTLFPEPCTLVRGYKNQDWFLGTGVSPSEHPLSGYISFGECDHCQNSSVLVIAAQHCVHPFSGDVYWDYEIICPKCGRFSTRSYSENG